MIDEKIEEMRKSVKLIFQDAHPKALDAVDEIMDIWARLKADGLYPFDFAWICYGISRELMLTHTELEDVENFARETRDSSEGLRKIVSENWPPPDQTMWPYTDHFPDDNDEAA